jgi:hypothetical protein
MAHFMTEDWTVAEFLPQGVHPERGSAGHYRPQRWAHRHGPATLYFTTDRFAMGVDGALLSNGRRVRAEAGMPNPFRHWRRPHNDLDLAWSPQSAVAGVRWQWGSVDIRDDDILFVDAPSCPVQYRGNESAFLLMIHDDPELIRTVSEFDGAVAFAWLGNLHDFVSKADGSTAVEMQGERTAGGLAASMRRLGEHYCDIAFSASKHDPAIISDAQAAIIDRLAHLGWVRKGLPFD